MTAQRPGQNAHIHRWGTGLLVPHRCSPSLSSHYRRQSIPEAPHSRGDQLADYNKQAQPISTITLNMVKSASRVLSVWHILTCIAGKWMLFFLSLHRAGNDRGSLQLSPGHRHQRHRSSRRLSKTSGSKAKCVEPARMARRTCYQALTS